MRWLLVILCGIALVLPSVALGEEWELPEHLPPCMEQAEIECSESETIYLHFKESENEENGEYPPAGQQPGTTGETEAATVESEAQNTAPVAEAPPVGVPPRIHGTDGHIHHARHSACSGKRHEKRSRCRKVRPSRRSRNSPEQKSSQQEKAMKHV